MLAAMALMCSYCRVGYAATIEVPAKEDSADQPKRRDLGQRW